MTPSVVTREGTNKPLFDNNVHTLWPFVVADMLWCMLWADYNIIIIME